MRTAYPQRIFCLGVALPPSAPIGCATFPRAARRAYMEPFRWRLKVSPTWKGGGQPRWTFRQGVPPLRAGRMRTPPAYQPRSLPPIIAHQLRSSLISLGHMWALRERCKMRPSACARPHFPNLNCRVAASVTSPVPPAPSQTRAWNWGRFFRGRSRRRPGVREWSRATWNPPA